MSNDREITIVPIDALLLRKAEQRFFSCEACNPEDAPFPFDNVLDEVTGSDPGVTDYVLDEPAHCPRCNHTVMQTACVEWYPDGISLGAKVCIE